MDPDVCLYKVHHRSGLGALELRIDSTGALLGIESEGQATSIVSTGHRITIKQVAAPTAWLPAYMSVDSAIAWLFYITKPNELSERLLISFKLPDMASFIEAGADSGESLTAIEFEDGVRQLHVGTQDEEYFSWCGEAAWMPSRLVPLLAGDKLLVTHVEANGLLTQVPELFVNEGFYLHYILAESPRRKSTEYPDEWDVATWYAVDQTRSMLEEAWNEQQHTAGPR